MLVYVRDFSAAVSVFVVEECEVVKFTVCGDASEVGGVENLCSWGSE